MNETTEQVYVIKSRELDDGHSYEYAETPDGKYIGTLDFAKKLLGKYDIRPQTIDGNNVCSIGYSPRENKWYGWSHRAIYGFGVGSRVKKGDCAYVGATPEDLIEDRVAFWSDFPDRAELARKECQILEDRSGIRILHAPMIIPIAKDMEQVTDVVEGEIDIDELEEVDIAADAVSIELCGHGEWTAKTLDDAKQIAIDFANGVA